MYNAHWTWHFQYFWENIPCFPFFLKIWGQMIKTIIQYSSIPYLLPPHMSCVSQAGLWVASEAGMQILNHSLPATPTQGFMLNRRTGWIFLIVKLLDQEIKRSKSCSKLAVVTHRYHRCQSSPSRQLPHKWSSVDLKVESRQQMVVWLVIREVCCQLGVSLTNGWGRVAPHQAFPLKTSPKALIHWTLHAPSDSLITLICWPIQASKSPTCAEND